MNSSLGPDELGRLLDEQAGPLALFASQWTDSPDDCVQEAFIELARQRPILNSPLAWLYRVVRNRAISQSRGAERRRRHEQSRAQLIANWASDVAEPLVSADEVLAALDSLAAEHREVVVARIWGGLTLEQTAEALGASTSTVHRRYVAALQLLRERLESPCQTNKNTSP
jgi:RNA polymerase sigma-70 factor (ECF subfamily)